MIVVEGPDGAGKTSLCNWICETFNLKMGKRSTRNRDELYKCAREDTWRAMTAELKCDEPPLVWDRLGPYSDPIYAPLRTPARKQAFTRDEIMMFHQFTRRLGLLIVCLPPFEIVQKNALKEHQMAGVAENIQSIWNGYFWLTGLQFSFQYDYEVKSSHSSVGVLVNRYLLARKERECLSSSKPATSASDPVPTEVSP